MLKNRVPCLMIAATTFASLAAFVPANKANAAEKTISKGELIKNTNFKDGWGLPWSVSTTAPGEAKFSIKENNYDVEVTNPGYERWHTMLTYSGISFEKGHTYDISFTVKAEKDCKLYAKIGRNAGDYKEFWNNNAMTYELKAGEELKVNEKYTMNDATEQDLAFQFQLVGDLAAKSLPYKYTFENISIKDSEFEGYKVNYNENGYAVRTNQIGYFTNGEKTATLVTTEKEPVKWSLVDSSNNVVASGNTVVFGEDKDSGDFVHKIDFSSYKKRGKRYKLVVQTEKLVPEYNQVVGQDLNVLSESPEFEISDNLYSKLKYDAFKYFYHNRSSVPIEVNYVDGRLDLAREAGHTKEVLECSPSDKWYKPYGTYKLDVTGGWYDAGDHGKYVVNGGISTWTLQNQYERALNRGEKLIEAPFGDGTMNIPEENNLVPDILDEARFNLEFMLKMQVPEGNKYAGMVHHCAHDATWTGLGMKPSDDDRARYIYAPTTAATLNLAATAAQGSRLWKDYDKDFANKCLEAAKKAFDAAAKNPSIYAPTSSVGGGTYDDNNVTDEFYWAACELYASTGEQKYLDYMRASKYYLDMPNVKNDEETGAINWANVEGLGTMTLLASKNNLPVEEIEKAKANVLKSADSYVDVESKNGYSVALERVNYIWASNANLANIMMVMAYANDISNGATTKYIDGANKSMDYLLGNNANTKCYVSGYGVNPLRNPHHRFWANEIDPKFPICPAGVLSGGPNYKLEDPFVQGAGWSEGSRPVAKCYIDDIQSYSTNECTINWNAPLAWMASYLDTHSNNLAKTDINNGQNYGENEKDKKLEQGNKGDNKIEKDKNLEQGNEENNKIKEDNKDNTKTKENKVVKLKNKLKKNKSVKTGDVSGLLSLVLCSISAGAAVGFRKKK